MSKVFTELSNDVISFNGMYLTRVDSAETLERKIYDEETEYGTIFQNVKINLKEKGSFTKGILITLIKDACDEEYSPDVSHIDIVISGLLGMFISDWY